MSFTHWQLKEGESFQTVKSEISKSDLDFITRYGLWREEVEDWEGDPQCPETYSGYKDQVMQYLHYQLHSVLQKETGLELLPTYTYFRVYRNGAVLAPHTDRPACEVSASMLIGRNTEKPWALIVGGESINQEVGDILIYRGCEVPHWREPLETEEGNYYVQLFAHYVDANGPYQSQAGDDPNNRI